MQTKEKEMTVKKYFAMWVKREFTNLPDLFHSDIYYSECYGPEYQGLSEIRAWIEDMLQKQTVLEWRIKQFIHQDHLTIVEWFFKEELAGAIGGFNGVSIIEFSPDGKIRSVKEFSSVAEHVRPFQGNE
ncbi:hypothetical protein NRIC_21250 [Enterococcus florum]|uniref:SnoaL-like domain-containing protein n=1 Tax=Enterococcus florum TaxID=2480627 RepID=A0A4P5PCK2_9ENTE|nr:nuclear transport factor 2 family protein [Enterococcus florum]GCF94234.1 hypothetical protein NRIC_21250 [Enterococcus florum]